MTDTPRPDHLDRLLSGDGSGNDALGAFLATAQRSLTAPPDDATAQRHLTAIVEAAQEHAHQAPLVAPAAGRSWRSRIAQVFGYTATKIAVGVGVAAAATGGLAATDTLPDPVQRAVSTGAAYIGVDFPYPEDRLAELDTPVEQLPTLPYDDGSERADDTRGATVDTSDTIGSQVPTYDEPADETPVEDVPPAEDAPVEDAPPVEPPPDEDTTQDPPVGDDAHSEPPTGHDEPPAEPPVEDAPPSGDSGAGALTASSTDG